MQSDPIRIGTRESQLAVWQANLVKELLQKNGINAELVFIKSEGDIDLTTPLYAMGVQGVFTRSLDIALLNNTIDIAVHSMKDVPVQLPETIVKASVLKRASHQDIFVINTAFLSRQTGWTEEEVFERIDEILAKENITIATSSVRRKAQWLAKYPHHKIENIRGNVNTRLQKVIKSEWAGAVFAAAGLERINVRPKFSINLEWMLPAPAQGAILVVCREQNTFARNACALLNHKDTDCCVSIERQFLSGLMGGCATPISAYAKREGDFILFKGSVSSTDGTKTLNVEIQKPVEAAESIALDAVTQIVEQGGRALITKMQNG